MATADAAGAQRLHALSIDLEDWFHPELVREHVPESERTPRLGRAVQPLLERLRARDIKVTFFVLGTLLDQERALMRRLHDEGHEIGCHGMSHRPLWELGPDDLRRELREWRAILEDVAPGHLARGYRAPTFSLDESTAWALDVLADEGFEYDSSIFPVRNHVYGVSGAPLAPYRPSTDDVRRHVDDGPILEFPLTALGLGVGGLRLPVSGGFYLRALPYPVLSWALGRVAAERPFVLYAHPWEFDVETPRRRLSPVDRWITYHGMAGALRKLDRLLDRFRFGRIDAVLESGGRSIAGLARAPRGEPAAGRAAGG